VVLDLVEDPSDPTAVRRNDHNSPMVMMNLQRMTMKATKIQERDRNRADLHHPCKIASTSLLISQRVITHILKNFHSLDHCYSQCPQNDLRHRSEAYPSIYWLNKFRVFQPRQQMDQQ
jgi:hypothetical protein